MPFAKFVSQEMVRHFHSHNLTPNNGPYRLDSHAGQAKMEENKGNDDSGGTLPQFEDCRTENFGRHNLRYWSFFTAHNM